MSRSKNGWLVEPPKTRKIRARNGDTADVRTGSQRGQKVHWIMQELVNEYERRIEPVVTVSGYRTKQSNAGTGTPVDNSNHRSATAIDINGYKYPYEYFRRSGYRQQFTGKKLKFMRVMLKWHFNGIIRWGHDFDSPYRDEMHYEIRPGVTNKDLAKAIRRIRRMKKRPGYGKVVMVDVRALNGRAEPSLKAKVVHVRKRGFKFRVYEKVKRDGLWWYMTKHGTCYAAKHCKVI